MGGGESRNTSWVQSEASLPHDRVSTVGPGLVTVLVGGMSVSFEAADCRRESLARDAVLGEEGPGRDPTSIGKSGVVDGTREEREVDLRGRVGVNDDPAISDSRAPEGDEGGASREGDCEATKASLSDPAVVDGGPLGGGGGRTMLKMSAASSYICCSMRAEAERLARLQALPKSRW